MFKRIYSDFVYITAKICNQPHDKRSSCEQQSKQDQRSSPASTNSHGIDEIQRNKIFGIVCDDIDDWRDLGRCFGIRDTALNWIASDRNLQPKLLTNRVLEQAEEKYGCAFKEQLCAALKDAGRNDILRKLNKLNLI